MRLAIATAAFAAMTAIVPGAALPADLSAPETILAGTRWMEIGVFTGIENIRPEKLMLLHDCFIADIAFLIEDGKLTRFDRSGLSGKTQPVGYDKVETEAGPDGSTLVTLHPSTVSNDMPDRYVIDMGGEIMRVQVNGTNGLAYMKCTRGTGAPQQPAPAGRQDTGR